jgi:hypothetical protein
MDIVAHWNEFDIWVALVVFVAYLLIDAMYTYYTLVVTRKKPVTSATVGVLMHFLIAFGVLNYVQNIPLCSTSCTWFMGRDVLSSKIRFKIGNINFYFS